MKAQNTIHSGLKNIVASLILAASASGALALTDTQAFPSSPAALGADFAVLHGPAVGTVLSASLQIGAEGVEAGLLGDDIGVVRIASLLSPDDYHFLGLLTPTDKGEYTESFFDVPTPLLHLLNEGMIVNVLVDADLNKDPDVSFRLHNSVLSADVRPNDDTHSTPDTGSTLLLLGAGFTLLASLRGRLS